MFEYVKPADRPVVDGLEEYETVYAADQPQYNPLRVLRSNREGHAVLSRWSPTWEQRRAIMEGADIFLELLTFGRPLQPIRIAVSERPGAIYFHEVYGLRAPEHVHGCAEQERTDSPTATKASAGAALGNRLRDPLRGAG